MEEVSLRFHHIKKQIFERLDMASLSKCRNVSIFWKKMIDEEKDVWIQKIQLKTNRLENQVKTTLRKKTSEELVQIANQILQVYNYQEFPLHAAAKYGYLETYSLILENYQNKNPEDDQKNIPMHYAAKYGQLDLCKLILKNLEYGWKKIPRISEHFIDYDHIMNTNNLQGMTPFDLAAQNGHMDVCRLIIENVDDVCPQLGYI